jgi:hypothetical protein
MGLGSGTEAIGSGDLGRGLMDHGRGRKETALISPGCSSAGVDCHSGRALALDTRKAPVVRGLPPHFCRFGLPEVVECVPGPVEELEAK